MMPTRRRPDVARRRLPYIAAVAGLALQLGVAMAEDLPVLRQGMWEFSRTMEAGGNGKPQVIATKKCTDPSADMKLQNAMLTKAGCSFSPLVRSGTTYTFTSQCTLQGISVQSRSVLSFASDSAYEVNVESSQGGKVSRERLVARRVGGC
jgi:hypothetical protein